MGDHMEQVSAILEREEGVLETLLFKLVATRLLLENQEHRFLSRSTREVERARNQAREVDLMRATTLAQYPEGANLRVLASSAPNPWPGILRDHHHRLASLVAEIEVTAHRNSLEARAGLEQLKLAGVGASAADHGDHGDRELARLARGAAFEAVLGTASRLRMPDLLDFLR